MSQTTTVLVTLLLVVGGVSAGVAALPEAGGVGTTGADTVSVMSHTDNDSTNLTVLAYTDIGSAVSGTGGEVGQFLTRDRSRRRDGPEF